MENQPAKTPAPPPGFQAEKPGETAVASKAPTLGLPERTALKIIGDYGDIAQVGSNVLQGAGSGLLSTVFHVGDLIRRATGMERIIEHPEVQKLIAPQLGLGGGTGRMIEQAAEFALPVGEVAKAVKAAPLLARAGAEALASGGVAALQTGGDPGATALGGVLGAAGPVAGRALEAVKGAPAEAIAAPAEAGRVAPGFDAVTKSAVRSAPAEATGAAAERAKIAPAEALLPSAQSPRAPGPGAKAVDAIPVPVRPGGAAVRPSRINAADTAAVDLAKREGIPVPASVPTGNRFVKSAEQMGASTLLGSGIAHRAQQRTAEAMTKAASRMAARAHSSPAIPETAGAALRGRLEARIGGLKQEADSAYADFRTAAENAANTETVQTGEQVLKARDAAGKPVVKPVLENIALPVDVRKLKTQLKPVLEEMSWMPAADRASSAGYTAVKKIIDGPNVISAVAAEHGLAGLKEMSRGAASADLRNASQGLAAGIIPDLQTSIDAAATKAGVLTQLKAGRAAHALKMEAADVLAKLHTEPVQVFNQATYANDSGIDLLRKLKQWAPKEMQVVGRGYLEKLFDTAKQEGGFGKGGTIWSQWQKLGPETKKILYPNGILRKDLDSFFLLGKKLSDVPNPSGTAATQHALGQLGATVISPHTGIAYIIGTGALTKLLYSPSGVRLLTRAMEASAKVPTRFSVAPITALLRRVGDEAQPVEADEGKALTE